MSTRANKQMRKIKKNSIVGTIFGGIISFVFMCTIVGGIFFAFTAYVFSDLYESCTKESKDLTTIMDAHISDNLQKIDEYASAVNSYLKIKTEPLLTSDKQELKEITDIISAGGEFYSAGIMFYQSTAGQIGDLKSPTGAEFYKRAIDGIYGVSSEKLGGKISAIYTAPVSLNGKEIGVLYGLETGNIEGLPYGYVEDGCTGATVCYLINESNDAIGYSGNGNPQYVLGETKRKSVKMADDYELYVESVKSGFGFFFSSDESVPEELLGGYNEKMLNEQSADFQKILEDKQSFEVADIWYKRALATSGMYTWVQAKIFFESKTLVKLVTAIIFTVLLLMIPFVLMIVSIVSKVKSNRKMMKLLYMDSLTGRGNWLWFTETVEKKLAKQKQKETKYAMVSFEINKFRLLSDYYGAGFGEEVLEKISRELGSQIGTNEVFARYAASQYALFLRYIGDNEINIRVNKILGRLSGVISGKKISFKAGIYVIEDKTMSADAINLIASGAKDTLHSSINTQVVMYDCHIRERQLKEKLIEDTMEAAMVNKEFKVFLQPKYDPNTKELEGAEALVRWITKDGGFISPGEFIPTFEKDGFIVKLDDYMLSEVAQIQSGWIASGRELVPISVNISRIHFTNENLAEHIAEIVDKYNVPHQYIELELTESAFFDDKETLLATVGQLHNYGFLVSMDDFGAGYSSLNSLKDIPLDVIKLDGEFFRNVKDKERGETVVKNTILLAKKLKMKIVAEGIETKEQVEFLQEQGCDLIQGFYFARPMPVHDFENLTSAWQTGEKE